MSWGPQEGDVRFKVLISGSSSQILSSKASRDLK